MAAHNNSIRVRLFFDYPPPGLVGCRMCWLLVDLNKCRVVADLESIIREKFDIGRRSIVNLFVEDCYLPHTESVHVVRDNDSVRVKLDFLAQVNGCDSCPDASNESRTKRQRDKEEDGSRENGVSVDRKKKKKKMSEERLEKDTKQTGKAKTKESHGKKPEKKRRKVVEENVPTLGPNPPALKKKNPTSLDQPVKRTKKPPAQKTQPKKVSSSDSSDISSEETEAPQKATHKTPAATLAPSKPPPDTKQPTPKKLPHPSSSSETDSSSDEETRKKTLPQKMFLPQKPPLSEPSTSSTPKSKLVNIKSQQTSSVPQSNDRPQKQTASSALNPEENATETQQTEPNSDEEIELVIRRPLHQPGFGLVSDRGRSSRGGRGGNRRGGGIRGQNDNFVLDSGRILPSYEHDSLINKSVVLQNEAESAPKVDYSSMPLLAAPPQVGQRIAFKLLELTESYTPAVSQYKEGKLLSVDPVTKQIEVELTNASDAPFEPGKFDLVYENPDGSKRVEYAVSRGSLVTERWDSLLEPRLIIQT